MIIGVTTLEMRINLSACYIDNDNQLARRAFGSTLLSEGTGSLWLTELTLHQQDKAQALLATLRDVLADFELGVYLHSSLIDTKQKHI